MSTILKALRRLEEEKRAGGERPLREEVAAGGPVPEARQRPSRLPWLLAATGVVCVGALVWLRWPGAEGAPGARDVAAQPAPVAPAPARAAAPAAAPQRAPAAAAAPDPALAPQRAPALALPRLTLPAAPPRERALPDEAFASDVQVVPRPAVQPRVPIEIARAAEPAPAPEAETAAEPAPTPPTVAAKPAPVVEAPKPAPKPEPVVEAPKPAPKPAPAPVTVAKTEPVAPPKPAAPPVPKAEPSPAPDASAPSVERTLWHPVASRRAAFVALPGEPSMRVQEGDVVGRYVVSEIRPTGVLFLQDGKPLERKVGAK